MQDTDDFNQKLEVLAEHILNDEDVAESTYGNALKYYLENKDNSTTLNSDTARVIINKHNFLKLKGYYDSGGFHSMGGPGLSLENFLKQLYLYKNLDEFFEWYNSLTPEEIEKGKENWCSGGCCQSLLQELININKKQNSK